MIRGQMGLDLQDLAWRRSLSSSASPRTTWSARWRWSSPCSCTGGMLDNVQLNGDEEAVTFLLRIYFRKSKDDLASISFEF